MDSSLAKKSFFSTFWSLIDQVFSKCIGFIIGIILARILSPSDFGLIGMIMVFILLADTFIESGISNALIRKLDRNKTDFSTAFLINLALSSFAYLILFLTAPCIAKFYNEPMLEQLLKVIGLNVILFSFCIVPNAIIISNFQTKILTRVNLASNIIAGAIAIFFAFYGLGVWSLVLQSILTNLFKTGGLWYFVKWRPSISFSKASFSYLFSYGTKSLAIGLLGTLFNNIYNLLIGKVFSKYELGLYTRSVQFGQVPTNVISSAFQKVSVATFAEIQNDKQHLLEVYRKYIHCLCFLVFPILFCMAVVAKPMILILLTEKWAACIPMVQILCIGMAFSPLGIINICLLQAINQMGYSFKLELYKKAVYLIIILCTFPHGVIHMVLGAALYNVVGTLMNFSCSKKFIGYNIGKQLIDIGKYVFWTSAISAITYHTINFIENEKIQLITGVVMFFSLYFLVSATFKFEGLSSLIALKRKVKR